MGSRPIVSRETLTLAQLRRESLEALTPLYGPAESQALFRQLMNHFWPGWQTEWLISRGEALFPSYLKPKWQAAIRRLLAHEPLAYITGEVHFLGLSLAVRPGVFIPRPETEAWVHELIQALSSTPPRYILDIGTGRGAIALALARAFPQAEVYAVEKSPIAAETACENARRHSLRLHLAQIPFGEAPLPSSWPQKWDLIVSNPPYIPYAAYYETELRVRLHEPPEALFCEDIEPTAKILDFASKNLNANACCVVEIFPKMAEKLISLCHDLGLIAQIRKDLSNRPRTLWVQR